MTGADKTRALFVAAPRLRKSRDPKPGMIVAGRNPAGQVQALMQVYTVTESNAKRHWRPKAQRAKLHRATAFATLRSQKPRVPCVVTMTRIAPRQLDDDNLPSALKHVRDGIADALGIDDRDPRVTWQCAQKTDGRGYYAVDVMIEEAPDSKLLPAKLPKPKRKVKP